MTKQKIIQMHFVNYKVSCLIMLYDTICMHVFSLFAGFTLSSVLIIYSLFWLIYILRLLLVLIFPLPSSQVYKLIHNRKIQITEVACVFIVAVTPNIILVATSEFHITNYPPVICGASIEITFYACIIPIMSANFIGLIVILFVLHKIHYVSQRALINVILFYSSLLFVA